MIPCGVFIQQQPRGAVVVRDDKIHIAIIVQITKCSGAADFGKLQGRNVCCTALPQSFACLIVKKLIALLKRKGLPPQCRQPFPFQQRNQLFHNEAGKALRESGATNIPALQLAEVSRAAAFGDLDNDGDVDIVVTNNNGPARLLLNENATGNHWLQLKLVGNQDNRQALGAKVMVQAKGQPLLHRRVHTDGSYLSASDPRVHFGLGKATTIENVTVEWPNGMRETFPQVKLDALNVLQQGSGVNRK